ncbi:MAG: S41 family peptidase [Candidatus Solibacter usitatus]|nr:S41 family peptidase [Candidatus Solibacter usitatus]
MANTRRRFPYFLSIIVLSAILGGIFGPRIEVAAAASDEDGVRASLKTFTKFYQLIEENFADTLVPDKAIYKGAVPGMLRTLDPHSNFFDPRDFQLLREEQKGHYYGVGMQVQPRNGKTIVLAPFAGSPAYRAGLRPGDVIIEVNDKKTDNLNTTEVADLLKGPRGTPVQIVIMRDGVEKPLTFNVIRDEISRKSVQDGLWLKSGVAYVDIDQFNENTSHELEAALKGLGENSIKGLIVDLRENPGGLLNEGVAVADKFLTKGQTIVSHRGRASAEKTYTARHGNGGRDYPIVVLVNRYSASAAEIVAGALQDHDRAWILGDNTFGKGLVQTVYPLAENSGLALTTAKYYTPSGRLIQRDYTNTSFFDYYYRKDTATRNPLDVKMTEGGRTVYGGGGIAPDEQYSPPKWDKFQSDLIRKYAFFNFTKHYFGNREAKLPKGWSPDEALVTEFHDFLLKQPEIKFTEAEFTQTHDWIKQNLQREMYTTAFSLDESRKFTIENDPMVIRAIDSLPKAKALLESTKKMLVQRMTK